MRLIYAGTPGFAVPALEALIAAGHEVALVLTQPDRPAGRGMHAVASAVKEAAQRHHIPLHQPHSLSAPEDVAPLIRAKADALVVTAYGLILPQGVLDITRWGAFNIHASLLPRWRGAAPIQRAILAGDRESGVCIIQMDAGLDTGAVIAREAVQIADDETSGSLHNKLALLGARLIAPALEGFVKRAIRATPQDEVGVTYAHKINKVEARIDWAQSAEKIERVIRAFDPTPGASTSYGEGEIKIWKAEASGEPHDAAPGSVIVVNERGVGVACAQGILWLRELQRAGAKKLNFKEFLLGCRVAPGTQFGPSPH